MTRTRRFLGGVTIGYVNLAVTTLAGLWLTPFFLDRLGQQTYGLWLVGLQLLAYLMLMDLGIVALLPRETAYATGRAGGAEQATDLPQILGRSFRLVLWQTPLGVVAAAAIWLMIPADWQPLAGPLGLVLAVFVVTFPLRTLQAALQGLQDLAFLGRVQLWSWGVATALTVALVLAGSGLYALAIGWASAHLLAACAHAMRLWARFPSVLPRRLPPLPFRAARELIGRGFWISTAQIAQALLHGTDVLILGRLLGPVAVVPFVCTGKLITVLANQPQLVMQAAAPALSEIKAGGPRARLFEVSAALTQAMLLASGLIGCVTLAVNQGFVVWWVGPDQYGGMALGVLLVVNMLLRHWNTTAVYALFCFGYERRLSLTALADGAITVGASVLGVWLIGPLGAPLGSIVGVVFVGLPANLRALARESEVDVAVLVAPLWGWLRRFAVVAAAASALSLVWVPATFVSLAGTTLLVGISYAAVMWPLVLRSTLAVYLGAWIASLSGSRIQLPGYAKS